ncbi:MAG: DUF2723 domain-containing protein [Myxococcales bacterium FL481]|nr:MAG: DUF2723 domain-containing protein [Myxococcales bacterium FL481]
MRVAGRSATSTDCVVVTQSLVPRDPSPRTRTLTVRSREPSAAEPPARTRTRPSARIPFALGLLAMAVTLFATYLVTLSPGVTPSDGPEIAAAVVTLGVIHPTGYPLFTLLAHAFLQLPLPGEPVVRIEVFNSLWGTAAAVLVALTVRRLALGARELLPSDSRAEQPATATVDLVALVAGFALGMAPLLWDQVRIPEVYAMHVGLVSAALYVWSRFETTRRDRLIVLAAVPMGLGLAHHVTMVYMLPAAAVLLLWRRPHLFWNWLAWPFRPLIRAKWPAAAEHRAWRGAWVVWCGVLVGGLPLLSYAYFVWANEHTTGVSWGGVKNWDSVYAHMTGRQYRMFMKGFGYENFWARVESSLTWFHRQFGWPSALPWGVGLIVVWKRYAAYGALLTVYMLANLYHACQYAVGDYRNYHLPSVVVCAVLIGVGAAYLFADLPQRVRGAASAGWRARLPMVGRWIVVAVGVWALVVAAERASERRDKSVRGAIYAASVTEELPAGAIFLSLGDGNVFPLFYEQHVRKQGREFAVIDVRMMHRRWYRHGYLARRHPTQCDPMAPEYVQDLGRWFRDCASYQTRLDLESPTSWLKMDVGAQRGGRRVLRPEPLKHRIITGGDPKCREAEYRRAHRGDCTCWDYNKYRRGFDHSCVFADEAGGIVRRHKQSTYAHRLIEDHIDERAVYEFGVFTRWLKPQKNPRKWNGPAYHRISGEYHLINRGRTNEIFRWSEVEDAETCDAATLEPLPARQFTPARAKPLPARSRAEYRPNPRPQLLKLSYLTNDKEKRADFSKREFEPGEDVWLELAFFERNAYNRKKKDRRGAALRHGLKVCVYGPDGQSVARRAVKTSGKSHRLSLLPADETRELAPGRYTIQACGTGPFPRKGALGDIHRRACVFPMLEHTFDVVSPED